VSPWIASWVAGLGAAAALMTMVWLLSLVRRDASVIDIFWGPGFALAAWTYFLLGDGAPPRKILVVTLVTIWGLRLAAHILWRGLGKGEDYRYREMRERQGPRFAWVSLFTIFLLQAVLLWAISAPLLQAQTAHQPAGLVWLDFLGALLFVVGFLFEALGDLQLVRFRADPANRGQVLQSGLWRYTRHPNYFGDALVWWGLWAIALATPGSFWTIFSPVLMTVLLMKVSGAALLEKKLVRTRPEYRDYVARTNTFFPWFPRSTKKKA